MMQAGGQPTQETSKPGPASTPFYIAATSSILERRPRTLKHGDTFGVFDHYGDIVSAGGGPQGLFHKDTRYLSDLSVLIDGHRPLLLSSTVQDNNAVLTADLANPDLYSNGRLELPRDTILIVRSKFLWDGGCYERLGVRSFDRGTGRIELSFRFAADFADIFELRGHPRTRRGQVTAKTVAGGAMFSYHGLDGVVRRSLIRFDPEPQRLDEESARFVLTMEPNQRVPLFMTVSCTEDPAEPRPAYRFLSCLRQAQKAARGAARRAASVESSNELFNDVLHRAVADLYMLTTVTDFGLFPYAGIPWFSTPFGRDAMITAIEMLWMDPAVAKGVLRFLAAYQATDFQPDAEAEPGKILHEMRGGEMARLGEVPFARYYGSVDSTPLFVLLAGLYFERTLDLATVSALWPNIEAAIRWIDEYGDRDKDGFVEYLRTGKTGLVNQGWKDSGDSIFHADGADAEGAIALCEVQGYVYAAKRLAAKIAAAIGMPKRGAELEREAEDLRRRFEDAFWCEEIGTYALALDGQKRPCRVRSSNAGQLLFTGIAGQERAAALADQLLGPEFFTGWGIRTIAASEARFNPVSYHNGSVWPHDNALIGLGLARYGLRSHAMRLLTGLYQTCRYVDLRRLPELICGVRRAPGNGPTLYPVACVPQAWASAAPLALLQASLGLEFDLEDQGVRFQRPGLPDFLDEITIRSLTVGDGKVDVALRRHSSDVSVDVLNREGRAQVTVRH